ncbi:MAG: bifunctional glutamine-synthetase adenylyltransferase/deadenyltransferase, partial [Propionibacteriaceae bacterium]|jgi:glutamate-ammonia-ligase adenylyltransferase|nr:bifunctional glutamine-synthetase adenylyltransferase/deadenyltransferase [Propionibacteriaceae bacterium]
LVRSLESYVTYYQKWSATWEAQALIRARHGAGERALSDALLWVIEPIRYPEAGLSREQFMEIRRLKARMESERIGRGLDPRNHLKLGPGGLSDVEWTIQSLQLRHAGRLPELRVTGTLEALRQLVQADLVTTDDADALQDAFLLASRARNAVVLVRNQVSDLLPVDAAVLGQVARTLGYPGGSHLADEWYRVARRARDVADRLFWVD